MWSTILAGQPWHGELVNRRKDGELYTTEQTITPVMGVSGEVVYFVALQQDLAGNTQGPLSLLQATLEATTDAILAVDREGRITGCNRKFQELWHMPESIIAARDSAPAVLHASRQVKDPEQFTSRIRSLYADHYAESFDVLEFTDGRIVERHSRPQLLSGKSVGRVWSFRDITERRQAEEEIKRLNENLEEIVEERTGQLDRAVRILKEEAAERSRMEAALRASEERARLKLDSILSPDLDIGDQELANILDVPAIQSLMDDFSKLTNMATAILDLKGNVLVSSGWQDVCKNFHRVHPETAQNCIESDLYLARNIQRGEHVAYKCKNNLWDVATPLYIGDKHVGNVYSGQFFYDGEAPDLKGFSDLAARCPFDREPYLEALGRVPHFSRERVKSLMNFLAKFADLVSRLSYSNLKLARAIIDQERIDAALYESEERFRLLSQRSPVPIAIANDDGTLEYLNDRFISIFGYTLADIPTVKDWFARAYPDDRQRRSAFHTWQTALDRALRERADIDRYETRVRCKDGSVRTIEVLGTKIENKMLVLLNDISARKQAEQENVRLEQQLQQAQKMEAVGRLAGGVAHDFNNLLTVINGYSDLALIQLKAGDPGRAGLLQIRHAGERAAELTRQLLAFSRKQVIQPSLLNLNDVVNDAEKMLERVIGEDIELVCLLDERLGKTKSDAGQMGQILMNLAVNSRDAMPDGGKLVIETHNIELDAAYAAQHKEVAPGAYVMLAVSDTGMGMTAEVKSHLFEPFFTTKEQGKGTGLGLATVFGIVAQNGGHIAVRSEPGEGTTFRVYLPRVEEQAADKGVQRPQRSELRGSETVLVVEDQEEVRKLTCTILTSFGYRVLRAAHGEEALAVCSAHPDSIDALITDVVMPHMSGWDLAARLKELRPEIRVLYMSGYTENMAMQQTVLDGTIDYVQKPFTPEGLVGKLRASLDRH